MNSSEENSAGSSIPKHCAASAALHSERITKLRGSRGAVPSIFAQLKVKNPRNSNAIFGNCDTYLSDELECATTCVLLSSAIHRQMWASIRGTPRSFVRSMLDKMREMCLRRSVQIHAQQRSFSVSISFVVILPLILPCGVTSTSKLFYHTALSKSAIRNHSENMNTDTTCMQKGSPTHLFTAMSRTSLRAFCLSSTINCTAGGSKEKRYRRRGRGTNIETVWGGGWKQKGKGQ